MKNKPSFNNLDLSENKHSPEEYNIPEREVKTWCSFMERGFRASRIMQDKQSVNHNEPFADLIEEEEEEESIKKLQPDEPTK